MVLRLSPPRTALGASAEAWSYGRHLMKGAIQLLRLQEKLGGMWILEHPKSSRSWWLPEVVALMGDARSTVLWIRSDDGEWSPAVKPTRLTSNSDI